MSDFVSRLLAAIAAKEEKAQALLDRLVWDDVAESIGRDWANWMPEDRKKVRVYLDDNDPAAVLRRCAADKAILKEHAGTNVASLDHGTWGQEYVACRTCAMGPRMVVYPCPTVKHLAAGYGISVEEETTGE